MDGAGRQRHSTHATPTTESAFRANTIHGPASDSRNPPSAGPIARLMFTPSEFSATAAPSSGLLTRSGTTAWNGGELIAAPTLSRNVATSRTVGVTCPVKESTVSPAAAMNTHSWEKSRYLRRSTMSAITPDGRAKRNIGRLLAACTSAISSGSALRVSMLQLMPTSLIHEPTLETTVAIHSMRNTGWLSGCQGETVGAGVVSTCASRTSLTWVMRTSPLPYAAAATGPAR